VTGHRLGGLKAACQSFEFLSGHRAEAGSQLPTPGANCRMAAPSLVPGVGVQRDSSIFSQTGDDRFNHPLGLMGIPYRDRRRPDFFGRIIVPAGKNRIPNEDHLIDRDVKDIP
jgi:hypothetical protein